MISDEKIQEYKFGTKDEAGIVSFGREQIGVFCTTPRKGALRESSGQNHFRIEAVML